MFIALLLVYLLTLSAVLGTIAASCDTSNPPTANPYYKKFCGRSIVVGFSQDFAPYSWKVDTAEEETETLRYLDSMPDYATLDGWVGLDPDIMDEVAEFLGFNYTVVDVRLPGDGDTWTSILQEYMLQIDIMGNNFALSTEREAIGFFSEKQVDMSAFLVQISSYEPTSYQWEDAFRFIKPFSSGVWLAMFICMIISAMVVFILDWSFYVQRRVEKRHEAKIGASDKVLPENSKEAEPVFAKNFVSGGGNEPTGQPEGEVPAALKLETSNDDDGIDIAAETISLFDSFYLAFASFTGAESFAPVSKPSKIFVASWSVLVLIVLSTYTANLAATLTKTNAFVEEIQSVDDAIKVGAKTCVSTRNVYHPSVPTSYSSTDEISQLYPFLEVNGLWTDLYEYMRNGTCRVAMFNREDITAALQDQQYCDLIVVGGMSDSDGNGAADSEIFYFSTGLVVNFNDTDLYMGVNAALQYLLKSGISQTRRNRWAGGVCTLDSEVVEGEVTSIQLKHLLGPFAVHFSVGCCIIVYAMLRHLVIYYNWDLKYFKRDITVHLKEDNEDEEYDSENEEGYDTFEANTQSALGDDQAIISKNFLHELSQRMSSLEREVRGSRGELKGHNELSFPAGQSSSETDPNVKKPRTGTIHDTGESFQSIASDVHEFGNRDLEGLGMTGAKRPSTGGGTRVFSFQSNVSQLGIGDPYSPICVKRNKRGKMKKRGSNYDMRGLRHISSFHVLR